jgi:hypothetical protein
MADDGFESRLRAIARQLSQSLSETDLDEVADRLGVDADRVRGAAGAVEGWLTDRAAADEPLFGDAAMTPAPAARAPASDALAAGTRSGPHPLDLPTDVQGRALSGLDSGRWTVRPGSGRLAGTGQAAEPSDDADLTGELRARDWITADGTVTLMGRQALLRWSRAADPTDADAAAGD